MRGAAKLTLLFMAILVLTTPVIRAQRAAGTPAKVPSNDVLPKDVYPDSRNRLPVIKREELSEDRKRSYDAAVARLRSVRPDGVAGIQLHASGLDVRWDAAIGRRLSELAILTTAREHDQPYEWSLHEMEAMSVGLEPAIIDIIRHRKPLVGVGEKESAIIQLGRELGKHGVTSATYARGLKLFGETSLVDLALLMAQYAGTSANLSAANQWMPPQMKQFLPLPFTPPDDILPDSRSRIPVVNPQAPPVPAQNPPAAPAGMYRRSIAPPPTGPQSMARFAAGLKSLEASQGRAMMALAILITAREHDSQYEWTLTETAARNDGLDSDIIDVVRLRKPLTGIRQKDATLIQFGRELFGKHYVTAETYARAKLQFGQRDLSDFVVGLMAPHARDETLLAFFDQQLPAGQKPLLPMP